MTEKGASSAGLSSNTTAVMPILANLAETSPPALDSLDAAGERRLGAPRTVGPELAALVPESRPGEKISLFSADRGVAVRRDLDTHHARGHGAAAQDRHSPPASSKRGRARAGVDA